MGTKIRKPSKSKNSTKKRRSDGVLKILKARNTERLKSHYLLRFVLFAMVAKIAINSFVSPCNRSILSPPIPQSSRRSSIQSCDSSASCKAPSIFEQNSASDRALEASRICAAIDVPTEAVGDPTLPPPYAIAVIAHKGERLLKHIFWFAPETLLVNACFSLSAF